MTPYYGINDDEVAGSGDMDQWFQDELLRLKEMERNKMKWELRLEELKKELAAAERSAEELEERLRAEEHDVAQLQGLSIANLFYTMIGSKSEKLKQENEEALTSKLRYDDAVAGKQNLKLEIEKYKVKLGDVINVDLEYERFLKTKESYIQRHDAATSEQLHALSEQKASAVILSKELKEAFEAGDVVLASLEQAEQYLQSAKNWGTYDMLGGGLISTMIKHDRIDDAKEQIHKVQHYLRQFARELKDVQMAVSVDFEIGGFLKFSDFFFDGLIADWMVQGKITNSLEQVVSKRKEIDSMVERLSQELNNVENRLNDLDRQYKGLIEGA